MNVFSALSRICIAALDVLLPPRERTVRTRSLSAESIPLSIREHDLLGMRITTLMDYQSASVRDLIRSLKYDGDSRARELCAGVLAEYLHDEFAESKLFSTHGILIIPLPLHASRKRERGFNQIELVIQSLPREITTGPNVSAAFEMLERTRATKPQTHFSRSERLSNVAGAFALVSGADLSKMRVYLIDDVATTGATLVNAAHPLRRAGADVHLIALARA